MPNLTFGRLTRWTARFTVAVVGVAMVAIVDAPHASAATEVIRLGLDSAPRGQSSSGPWRKGCFPNPAGFGSRACIASAAGGSVSPTNGGGQGNSGGQALAYSRNGRVVLAMSHAARYNPGTADFLISARVRLSSGQVTHGANLVQKGYYRTPGGQWQLQVDRGRPSCRIAGTRDGQRVSAFIQWRGTIADQGWTRLRCWRYDAQLVLQVGDAPPVASAWDARMRIANRHWVTIGGKGTGPRNDQFRGSLDDVIVVTGP